MVTPAADPSRVVDSSAPAPERRWLRCDWAVALGLFSVTAAVILWQNARLAVLWDLSYVLDTADRMALGQMPYRDFPLAHPPLTFAVQAAILRLTGRVYWHHIVYVALAGSLATVLTWRIALEWLRGRAGAAGPLALLLAAPLVPLGIYCILPHPSYDCDCAFWMLVAIWALLRLDRAGAGPVLGFSAGALACVPLFFKQNMGLPFLAAVVGAAALLRMVRIRRPAAPADTSSPAGWESEAPPDPRLPLALLCGVAVTLGAAALVLHLTAGIGNYLHWTIGFAAQRRLPGLAEMLGVYLDPGLLWELPSVAAGVFLLHRARKPAAHGSRIAAVILLAAPFLWTLCSLLVYDDADERADALLALWPLLLIVSAMVALWNLWRTRSAPGMRTVLPLVIVVAINGTLMSQQLWGSTYAIWPLLVLLLADLVAALAAFIPRGWPVPAVAALVAGALLFCGGYYTASEDRLSYAQIPAGPVQHSAFPQLAGLATPGDYLPDFDELLRYAAAHIPQGDGLILLPGEDPFYYATGRVPRFPVLLFDPATDPYTPGEVMAKVESHQIRWLIVKRHLQLTSDPMPEAPALLLALEREFTLAARLRGYDVYRR